MHLQVELGWDVGCPLDAPLGAVTLFGGADGNPLGVLLLADVLGVADGSVDG